MRAAYYDRQGEAEDVLIIGDLEQPVPERGEVLVRVHVSGLNPTDLKARSGFSGSMAFDRIVPHQDGAGVIEAVGEEVPPGRIGQRVWIYEAQSGRPNGTAAEFTVVPAHRAVPLPEGVSFLIGASLGIPAMTAHRCLFADGGIRGARVLVHGGAGVVGSSAILLAKWAGAWVSTTVRNAEQEAIAARAGADLVIRLDGDVPTAIRAATNGAGVDRIVDVDLAANLDTDLTCLANGGVISSYAMREAHDAAAIPVLRAMVGGAVLRFVFIYTVPQAAKDAAAADITACLAAGAYAPLIGMNVPLERIVDAHLALERRKVMGKVLVRVEER